MESSTIEKELVHRTESSATDAAPGLSNGERVDRAYRFRSLSAYSLTERLLIRAAGVMFYYWIRAIGRSARFEVVGWENFEAASSDGHIPIYTSWHNSMFLGMYFWRRRGIIIMSSRSFDAEYTARCLQRFGYGVAKGSSTRGAVGGLIELARLMRAGCPTGFTIDGPKGPRFVAKMGAVLLAKRTGHPVLPFTVSLKNFREVNSWDRFQIPRPFTRALVYIAPPIFVPRDADKDELNARRDELQRSLDEINRLGEQWRRRLVNDKP